jgi:hypothetical protein
MLMMFQQAFVVHLLFDYLHVVVVVVADEYSLQLEVWMKV